MPRAIVGHVVIKPAPTLGEDFRLASADLLPQLAPHRLPRGFARIDATLRHLPCREARRHVDAATNEG
jgi:hypothetical protein